MLFQRSGMLFQRAKLSSRAESRGMRRVGVLPLGCLQLNVPLKFYDSAGAVMTFDSSWSLFSFCVTAGIQAKCSYTCMYWLLGQRHCSRWFRGLVTIPGGEYIYSASTQRLYTRMYILYDSYGSPKVRRALPTVRAHTNTHSCRAPCRRAWGRAGGDSMQTKRAGGASTPTAHVQCGGGAPPYAGGAWRVTELFTEGESQSVVKSSFQSLSMSAFSCRQNCDTHVTIDRQATPPIHCTPSTISGSCNALRAHRPSMHEPFSACTLLASRSPTLMAGDIASAHQPRSHDWRQPILAVHLQEFNGRLLRSHLRWFQAARASKHSES